MALNDVPPLPMPPKVVMGPGEQISSKSVGAAQVTMGSLQLLSVLCSLVACSHGTHPSTPYSNCQAAQQPRQRDNNTPMPCVAPSVMCRAVLCCVMLCAGTGLGAAQLFWDSGMKSYKVRGGSSCVVPISWLSARPYSHSSWGWV